MKYIIVILFVLVFAGCSTPMNQTQYSSPQRVNYTQRNEVRTSPSAEFDLAEYLSEFYRTPQVVESQSPRLKKRLDRIKKATE